MITVINWKGGVGKSAIALNLYFTLSAQDKEWGLVTNDLASPLNELIADSNFLKLAPNQQVPPQLLDPNSKLIFDLAGAIDQRCVDILKASSQVIVPIINDFVVLKSSLMALKEIEKFNQNITVIANRVKSDHDVIEIKKIIGLFHSYPVIPVKESKALSNVFIEKKSVSQMVSEGGLKGYHYSRVRDQFNSILEKVA